MHHKLGLFVRAGKEFARSRASSARKLYTDHIYPYPHNYVSTKIHPRIARYRETWEPAPWQRSDFLLGKYGMVAFWTYWWYMLMKNPQVILGHEKIPDPSEWTDDELGIPPDAAGSYEDWIEAKLAESQ